MLDVYLYIMTVNNNSRVLLVFTSFLGFRSTVHISFSFARWSVVVVVGLTRSAVHPSISFAVI